MNSQVSLFGLKIHFSFHISSHILKKITLYIERVFVKIPSHFLGSMCVLSCFFFVLFSLICSELGHLPPSVMYWRWGTINKCWLNECIQYALRYLTEKPNPYCYLLTPGKMAFCVSKFLWMPKLCHVIGINASHSCYFDLFPGRSGLDLLS